MKAVRVFLLSGGRYREAGLMMEDGRWSGDPGLEGTVRRVLATHGMEEGARRLSHGLVECRLEDA